MGKDRNQIKKFVILFCTFIVPLLFFLFLASGKVNFTKLPVLTEKVSEVNSGAVPLFVNKVSVVSFIGKSPSVKTYQNFLNLYQVVYKKSKKFKKFQMVTLIPEGKKEILQKLKSELAFVGGVELEKWEFVEVPEEKLQVVYQSFQTPLVFDVDLGLSEVFIIDEELNLRGRTNDEDVASGVVFGYNMESVSVLKNKLVEDINVVFYESKFAVKEQETYE